MRSLWAPTARQSRCSCEQHSAAFMKKAAGSFNLFAECLHRIFDKGIAQAASSSPLAYGMLCFRCLFEENIPCIFWELCRGPMFSEARVLTLYAEDKECTIKVFDVTWREALISLQVLTIVHQLMWLQWPFAQQQGRFCVPCFPTYVCLRTHLLILVCDPLVVHSFAAAGS